MRKNSPVSARSGHWEPVLLERLWPVGIRCRVADDCATLVPRAIAVKALAVPGESRLDTGDRTLASPSFLVLALLPRAFRPSAEFQPAAREYYEPSTKEGTVKADS